MFLSEIVLTYHVETYWHVERADINISSLIIFKKIIAQASRLRKSLFFNRFSHKRKQIIIVFMVLMLNNNAYLSIFDIVFM